MAEDLNRESIEREKTHRAEQTPARPGGGEGLFVPEIPSYPSTLLGDPRLNGRGNAPVRAAVIQRMQQTYGNRAVQRLLQQQRTASDALLGTEESREHIRAEAGSRSRPGRGVAGQLLNGSGAGIQTARASSVALPVQRAGDGAQQPQGDSQDKDKKKEPMEGQLPPIKGEPVPVPGGCDDGGLQDAAADSGSDMPARPLRFNVQLDMGADKSEGIDRYGPGAADGVNTSLTFGSTVTGGGVTIPAGAFGYSQPTFTADNIKWQSANDIITVNARIFVEVNWTVGAPGGQMDVKSADDEAVVTENSWEKIVEDLTPDGTGKPKRDSYWMRSITLDHEKFHADEYITRAQGILPAAQSIINRGDIPNHIWTSKVDIINEINRRIEEAKKWMESDVHTFYSSGGEERAYGAGKGAYEALTQAIKAKATTNKWKKKPTAAAGAPAQRMSSTTPGMQVQRTPEGSQVAVQRGPDPAQAPAAGPAALPKFETWPKDMPRRTVGQVTVKPSQGGADPTTTAPADPASQSSDADRQKAIDAILEKVKANRAGINERFMRLASTKGYMYTAEQEAQSGSGANQQEAAGYEKWRKSGDATPDAVKKNPDDPLVKAQVELWQDIGGEGDPSSMNTWDVMNVTFGRGFAAGGQLQQVMQILFKSDPDAAKIFFDAGIAMEGGQFLVVNLDSKLAENNDSAEHVIQVDRKLVSLFVNLAQSKEHRKAVVNAQWETFIKNTGNMPPEVVAWGDRKARAVAGHNIHGGNFSWGNFKGDGGSLKKVVATIGYKLGTTASNGAIWVPGHVTKARLQQLAHGWAMDALEKKPYKVVEEQPEEPNSTPNTPVGPHSTMQGEAGHIYFEIPGQANSWYELIP